MSEMFRNTKRNQKVSVFNTRCVCYNESSCYCHDVCPSDCPSVCLSGTDMHCDHMVHISADLSLWLDRSMFWAPWHQSMSTYSQPSFSGSTWKTGGV